LGALEKHLGVQELGVHNWAQDRPARFLHEAAEFTDEGRYTFGYILYIHSAGIPDKLAIHFGVHVKRTAEEWMVSLENGPTVRIPIEQEPKYHSFVVAFDNAVSTLLGRDLDWRLSQEGEVRVIGFAGSERRQARHV
jgi:hypothetical protein